MRRTLGCMTAWLSLLMLMPGATSELGATVGAGSRNGTSVAVIELHGSLWRVRCVGCGRERADRTVPEVGRPPRCADCGELERPAVVWFGEALDPDRLERAAALTVAARLVLVVGTSGIVEPAASLPYYALRAGAYVVEVNPEPTPLSDHASCVIAAASGEALPVLVDAIVRRAKS